MKLGGAKFPIDVINQNLEAQSLDRKTKKVTSL
jgi:hypothetical protein